MPYKHEKSSDGRWHGDKSDVRVFVGNGWYLLEIIGSFGHVTGNLLESHWSIWSRDWQLTSRSRNKPACGNAGMTDESKVITRKLSGCRKTQQLMDWYRQLSRNDYSWINVSRSLKRLTRAARKLSGCRKIHQLIDCCRQWSRNDCAWIDLSRLLLKRLTRVDRKLFWLWL
jgi:hypothetical protein